MPNKEISSKCSKLNVNYDRGWLWLDAGHTRMKGEQKESIFIVMYLFCVEFHQGRVFSPSFSSFSLLLSLFR